PVHHEVRRSALVPQLVDVDHVRVSDLASRASFPDETLNAHRVFGHVRPENFHGDPAPQVHVLRLVNDPDAAPSELARHAIRPDRLGEAVRRLGGRDDFRRPVSQRHSARPRGLYTTAYTMGPASIDDTLSEQRADAIG